MKSFKLLPLAANFHYPKAFLNQIIFKENKQKDAYFVPFKKNQNFNTMKTLKLLGVVALFLSFTMTMQAQDYSSAIGLRLGVPLSVSYKHFLGGSNNAIEAFAGFRSYSGYGWFNVGALYQVHKPIADVEGLRWYFGGGASVFFWNYDNGFVFGDKNNSTTSIGILGNLGLDYKFVNAPINLSLDWVPAFFVNGYASGFGGGYGALSVRYVLN